MIPKKWYTLSEITAVTGLAHTTLLQYVKTGILKATKMGGVGKWRVSEENLRLFIAGKPQKDYTGEEDK